MRAIMIPREENVRACVCSRPVLKGQVANGEDRFWQGPKWNDGYAFGNEDQRGVLAIGFMRSLVGGGPFLSK